MDHSSATRSPAIDETTWVQATLVRRLMQMERHLHVPLAVVLVSIVGLLWENVPPVLLLGWFVLGLAVLGARLHHGRRFWQIPASDHPAQLRSFERGRWLWPAMAWVLAATVPMFFDRVPVNSEFTAWLVILAVAIIGAGILSPQLRLALGYVHILLLVSMATVGWQVLFKHGLGGPLYHFWLLALLVVLWQVLQQVARQLHQMQRSNLQLQHRNELLIDSLTRQTQAALDAIETKNRFLASATHDIRQPVHALGLYADWLASEPDMVGDLAPKIVESTRAVNALFDSLFDLVRLEGGGVQVRLEEVSLGRLLGEMEVQYRPLAQAKGLVLRLRARPTTVVSDPVLLRRIVGNLLSNAIKYSLHGGVLLAVRQRAGVPCIEVWDTGVGIAPHHQRDIFQEFYKVPIHGGTEEGFGLGLYIVSRLSQIMGYAVDVRSRPGRGSMFRVVLTPVDPQQVRERVARSMLGLRSAPHDLRQPAQRGA